MTDMRDAIVVLLAGGQGERLWPLTRDRAKPAVPFGAAYRIIDINSLQLHQLRSRAFSSSPSTKLSALAAMLEPAGLPLLASGEFIEILPPQMRVSKEWYRGTADAVYQNIYSIGSERSKHVFILSGDHIYKMNYAKMLPASISTSPPTLQ